MVPAVSEKMDLLSRFRTVSRRNVFRGAFWLMAAPAIAAFGSLVSRQDRASRRPRQVTVPAGSGEPVVLMDDIVVCRNRGQVTVFSARCTHLGCRITQAAGGLLVCPCHGSRFRLDGGVAAGPAARPLERLPYSIDPRTGALVVHVS